MRYNLRSVSVQADGVSGRPKRRRPQWEAPEQEKKRLGLQKKRTKKLNSRQERRCGPRETSVLLGKNIAKDEYEPLNRERAEEQVAEAAEYQVIDEGEEGEEERNEDDVAPDDPGFYKSIDEVSRVNMVARDQGRQDGGNDTLAEEEVDLDKGETGATVDGDCSRGYDGQGDRNEDDEDDENNSPENGELEDPESNRKSGKVANSEPVGDSEQGVTPITNSKTPSTPPLHDSSDMKWTPVHPDSLTSIISLMSCRGWSTYYLYNQRRDSSKKKWLQHYEPNPMFKEWERLADAAYTLFEIYQATARVPHYGQQLSHLRRNETVLKETHASLERVYTEMLDEIETSERHDRLQLAAKIHGTVIPLVVMCLQEAFLMGTASDKLTVARFTTTTLQQVWRHCMSIRKLYDAISEVYLVDGLQHDQEASSPAHKSSPATKNRNYLHRHLSALSKDICQAQERLDSRKCARLDETQQLWRECRDEERIRREYLNKHGWELSEDEALLDVLRGQQTLSLAVMRACAPSRTELDVRQRVNVLRDKAMRVLAQRGLEIPDWCR